MRILQSKILMFCFLLAGFLSPVHPACAGEEGVKNEQVKPAKLLKDPGEKISIFRNFSVRNFFDEVVDVSDKEDAGERVQPAKVSKDLNEKTAAAGTEPNGAPTNTLPTETELGREPAASPAATAPAALADARAALKVPGPVFVENFKPEHMLPPEQVPRVRLNPEAPAPFLGMAMAHQEGDDETAAKYADTWVRYQQNLFFEVRELTELIGQALIRQNAIKEDDWDGVQQYIDYEMAKVREEKGEPIKPTHERAMERIKPDPKGKADVYFFFTMNCTYCRFMAPDVERLWRAVKNDPNVRMVGVTLGTYPQLWVDQYREYTGATFPIENGEELAKAFNLKFVPALVVMAPNGKKAYFKAGQQSFANMYDFVRHVQGLPSTINPNIERLLATPIGQIEKDKVKNGEWNVVEKATSDGHELKTVKVEMPKKDSKVSIERF